MRLGIFAEVTGSYNAFDAWAYDKYIAPAVQVWFDRASGELGPVLGEAKSLLDVGCGGGHLLAHVAERYPGVSLHGIDLLPKQVARANARLGAKGLAGRVVEGSALDLPYASGTIDVVVSIASIKHWPDPERGLSECCRVLRPGGTLLVVEADRGTRLEDLKSFVYDLRFPRTVRPMLPLLLPVVRTFVHGQSRDLDEMRALRTKNLIRCIRTTHGKCATGGPDGLDEMVRFDHARGGRDRRRRVLCIAPAGPTATPKCRDDSQARRDSGDPERACRDREGLREGRGAVRERGVRRHDEQRV